MLKYEEVEKLIEENGGFMDQMRVNLSKLERRSLRRMMFTSVAAAVVAAAALMGCIYFTVQAREGERQARAEAAEAKEAAAEAVAERDRVMGLLELLEAGLVIEQERTVDEYTTTTTTTEQTAEGDTAIITNNGTTVTGEWVQGE